MITSWRTAVAALATHYRALAHRERALVAMALLAATWLAWQTLLADPLALERQRRAAASALAAEQLRAAVDVHLQLQEAVAADPEDRLAREKASLERELAALDDSLGVQVDRFVEPERMAEVLEALMTAHTGLVMVRAENLRVEALGGADDASPRLYRHPLRMVFRGGYFDVVGYLETVERGPWSLGWRSLDYRVDGYPVAEVTLELETLSRDARWIGL